jgi:hypothetical protein
LEAAAERFGASPKYWGFDVNPSYVTQAKRALTRLGRPKVRIQQGDFYATDWKQFLSEQSGPILLIGNPPWITNAGMAVINGRNLPEKINSQGHRGLDAITGKANFDISEWMLNRMVEALDGRDATLAMLVKTVVARKVLRQGWAEGMRIVESQVFQIDAMTHFDAAVEASLLVMKFGQSVGPFKAPVYGQVSAALPPIAMLGFVDGEVVPDLAAFEASRHLSGAGPVKWRSGIKHDCAAVMELHREGDEFRNRLGELVEVEPDYLFPMLKTSEVANGKGCRRTRYMVVPQRQLGEDTAEIKRQAPRTWRYLSSHSEAFARRGSSIYVGKPAFSVFGVGDYTFAPWKVAISGMYKTLRFLKVGPRDGKPVVFDDVTNFLPCASEHAADLLVELLETPSASTFFRGRVFWDAKRPITVDLLNRLNLMELAKETGRAAEFSTHFPMVLQGKTRTRRQARVLDHSPTLW